MLLPQKLQRNSSSLSHLETWHPNGDTDAQVYRSEQSPKVSNLYKSGWEVCKGPQDQAFLKRQLLTLWRFRVHGTLAWSLHNKMQGRNLSSNIEAGWKRPSLGRCQVFLAKRDPSNGCYCGHNLCPPAGLRFSCSQGYEPTSHHCVPMNLRLHLPKCHEKLTTLFRKIGNWLLLPSLQGPAQTRPILRSLPSGQWVTASVLPPSSSIHNLGLARLYKHCLFIICLAVLPMDQGSPRLTVFDFLGLQFLDHGGRRTASSKCWVKE